MKKVLVLGAGMVAGAHVGYLLGLPDVHVIVASRTLRKAEEVVGGHPRGEARQVDLTDEGAVEHFIRECDVAVSLLPFVYHPVVAALCVKHGRHMVSTSYVKEPMAALDGPAKEAGVILLNEMGVDPGIDHMTAMRVIDGVRAQGGAVTSFRSWCGGLPAPEANTNPFGYKFSWSPRGVLLAGMNPARYLEDGGEVFVDGDVLFDRRWTVPVAVEGTVIDFEGYPNRDSLPYRETYGLTGARTMFRGTLRYAGWCEVMNGVKALGLLGEEVWEDLEGLTYRQFTARLLGGADPDVRSGAAAKLGVSPDAPVIRDLDWLGFFGDDPLAIGRGAPVDVLTARMLEKMSYESGERDMLVLQHQFLAEYPAISAQPARNERIVSTMIDFGIPGGDTSMSRTVGLPAAIGVKLILQGAITLTGVQVPVVSEIYEPMLDELEALGIHFTESWESVA
jgi:saccharopine dehydrogenase (NADP+, L-glutamate forming)